MMRFRICALMILLIIVRVHTVHTQGIQLFPESSISIKLDSTRQIFHLDSTDAMGLRNVPDQHTCIVRQPDSSYQVYITGVIGRGAAALGGTALLSTRDFLHYTPVVGTPAQASAVLLPSCLGNPGPDSCSSRYDADYAGANLVYPASNGKDLMMLYYAGNTKINNWAAVALARSNDNGHSWTRIGLVVTGRDSMPTSFLTNEVLGVVEPGAIVANGYIYLYYSYFPNPNAPDSGHATIQVARAPLSGDGMPGTWTKYYNGSFGSESGLGGRGSKVVPDVPKNLRPAQPWPAYSEYLHAYILLFIAQDGWFFTTSTDLVNWSQPALYYAIKTFQDCQPNDDNVVFVTPGNPGQILGKTGYAIYSHTPHYGFKSCPTVEFHELWVRPFSFSDGATDVQSRSADLPKTVDLEQNYPNPFNPSTVIRYGLPQRSQVTLAVFNTLGQQVAQLVRGDVEAGYHEVRFDATGFSSGVYFYRLSVSPSERRDLVTGERDGQSGANVETRKLLLIR